MEKSMQSHGILERLLSKTGGWYIIIVLLLAQLAASTTTLLGVIFEQLNADYSPETNKLLNRIELVFIPALIITLIIIVFILTRDIHARLNAWKPASISK